MARPRKSQGVKKISRARKPSRAMPRSTVGRAGPVTLAEARALAQAKQPGLALRKTAATVSPPASPAALGAERKRLAKERRDEFARRVREYKAIMAIMKKRGARPPQPPKTAKSKRISSAAKAAAFVPLQIFAEGDSWFEYPYPFFGGGIIKRLEDRLGVPILNLAKAGDEVRYMLGVEERKLLIKHLKQGSPAGGPWDMLLFSGGGNDIVDNPMALWIRDWAPGKPPVKHIHQQRYDAALALVRAGYEDLIALRDALSPKTHLVFQGYDFAIPDGRGVCHLGPWLKPTFDLRNFPQNLNPRRAVVKEMLLQFAAMLSSLTVKPKVTFINGQGTLSPAASSWHNELHPSRDGFNAFARLFYHEIKQLYPTRVA